MEKAAEKIRKIILETKNRKKKKTLTDNDKNTKPVFIVKKVDQKKIPLAIIAVTRVIIVHNALAARRRTRMRPKSEWLKLNPKFNH